MYKNIAIARPNKFKSKQELERFIEAYFTEAKSSGRPPNDIRAYLSPWNLQTDITGLRIKNGVYGHYKKSKAKD